MNRRGFLAALFAPILAKIAPAQPAVQFAEFIDAPLPLWPYLTDPDDWFLSEKRAVAFYSNNLTPDSNLSIEPEFTRMRNEADSHRVHIPAP